LGKMDQLDQGALAGARVPGQEQHLAGGHVETDLGERNAPTGVLLADAVETQDGHGGGVSQNSHGPNPTDCGLCDRSRNAAAEAASRARSSAAREPAGARAPAGRATQCWLCGARVTSLRSRVPMRENSDGACAVDASACRDADCGRGAGAGLASRVLGGALLSCPSPLPAVSSAPATRLPPRRRRRLRRGRQPPGLPALTAPAASITGLATASSCAAAAGADTATDGGAATATASPSGFSRGWRGGRARSPPAPPARGPRPADGPPAPLRPPRPPPRLASSAARSPRTSR